jgi:DUF1680 family protein
LTLLFENGEGPKRFVPRMIQIGGRDVLALEGSMLRIQGERDDRLYAEMRPSTREEVPVQFVPYFAWDNRSSIQDENPEEDAQMKIWFPVVR